MKIRLVAFLFLQIYVFGCDHENIDEIASENHLVIQVDLDNAELHLLNGNSTLAIEKFSQVLSSAKEEITPIQQCRALFGRSLAFATLDDEKNCFADLELLDMTLNNYSCIAANEMSIPGPDQISIEDCLDRVTGTESVCGQIVSFLPIRIKLKTAIIASISTLAYNARVCCRQGGLWKACLGPILEKWRKLDIWKNFGVPADPMWD